MQMQQMLQQQQQQQQAHIYHTLEPSLAAAAAQQQQSSASDGGGSVYINRNLDLVLKASPPKDDDNASETGSLEEELTKDHLRMQETSLHASQPSASISVQKLIPNTSSSDSSNDDEYIV